MKNKILLVLLVLAGAVLGAMVSGAASGTDALKWLAYSKEIGISPTVINLVIIKFTVGFELSVSAAQVIFMLIAVMFYPKLSKLTT